MKSATFVLEGDKKEADSISAVLTTRLSFIHWKHIINYKLDYGERDRIFNLVTEVGEAFWPTAKASSAVWGNGDG